jgi:hypothetical protein
MAISAVNLPWLVDPHDLQGMLTSSENQAPTWDQIPKLESRILA